MRPMINLLILNVMPLLHTNICNSAPNLNIRTILSAIQTLECVHFKKKEYYIVSCKKFSIVPGIYKEKKTPTMGKVVVVGL